MGGFTTAGAIRSQGIPFTPLHRWIDRTVVEEIARMSTDRLEEAYWAMWHAPGLAMASPMAAAVMHEVGHELSYRADVARRAALN